LTTKSIACRVLCFDFDGVILESVHVKDECYWQLFDTLPNEVRDSIRDAHMSTPGMKRPDKVSWLFEMAFGRTATPKEITKFTERYAALVEGHMNKCSMVEGIKTFLETIAPFPKYIASAAPELEIKQYAAKFGIARNFREIFGMPHRKDEVLRQISDIEGVNPAEIMFIGDREHDLTSAQQAGVTFVGRVPLNAPNPFPTKVPIIQDFIQGARLLRSMIL
jgi:phosphoglycolate phosphatase-like HAD superfamily hydrolase